MTTSVRTLVIFSLLLITQCCLLRARSTRPLDVLAATSGNYFCIGLNDLALTAEEKEDYRYRSRGSRHSGERLRSYCANELTNRPTEVRGRGRGWVNLNVK